MGANILVVDNDPEFTNLIEIYLSGAGHTVFKCYSGEDALLCFGSININLAIINIILSDVFGINICRRIKEKYNKPVILITPDTEDIQLIASLTVGANSYISKPIEKSSFITLVNDLLTNKESKS